MNLYIRWIDLNNANRNNLRAPTYKKDNLTNAVGVVVVEDAAAAAAAALVVVGAEAMALGAEAVAVASAGAMSPMLARFELAWSASIAAAALSRLEPLVGPDRLGPIVQPNAKTVTC